MQNLIQQKRRVRTVFSETCVNIMDFYLINCESYFTPLTTSLSMKKPYSTIKDCMLLLKQNSYLTKLDNKSIVYHITKANMEFWRTDYKQHIITTYEIKKNKVK